MMARIFVIDEKQFLPHFSIWFWLLRHFLPRSLAKIHWKGQSYEVWRNSIFAFIPPTYVMNSASCYITKSVICILNSPLYSMSVWVTSEKCTLAVFSIKGTGQTGNWPQSSEIGRFHQIHWKIVKNGRGCSHYRLLQRNWSWACWLFCQGRIQGENPFTSIHTHDRLL